MILKIKDIQFCGDYDPNFKKAVTDMFTGSVVSHDFLIKCIECAFDVPKNHIYDGSSYCQLCSQGVITVMEFDTHPRVANIIVSQADGLK